MRGALAGALLLAAALCAVAQTTRTAAAPSAGVKRTTPNARAGGATPKSKRPGPPLDFSGVWVLDAAASRGVSPAMEGAVLSVRQNGNHIWIEPIERKEPVLLSEEVVVDGRPYEKGLGPMKGRKGTLVADWGKDGASLWLQVEVSDDGTERSGVQRAVWRLRENGSVWTRQTRTITKDEVKDTFLVFRKRDAKPAKP